MGYQPKFYRTDNGDTAVVASSGQIDVESGGHVDVESGGILDLQTGAILKNSTVGVEVTRSVFVEKVPFTGTASTAGSVFGWTGPTGSNILITGITLDITTQSATAGCVLDVGTTTTSLTTKSDNLIDGLVATGTAALGAKSTVHDTGANGIVPRKLTAGKFVTCSATGGKATSLAGSAYIEFVVV